MDNTLFILFYKYEFNFEVFYKEDRYKTLINDNQLIFTIKNHLHEIEEFSAKHSSKVILIAKEEHLSKLKTVSDLWGNPNIFVFIATEISEVNKEFNEDSISWRSINDTPDDVTALLTKEINLHFFKVDSFGI